MQEGMGEIFYNRIKNQLFEVGRYAVLLFTTKEHDTLSKKINDKSYVCISF